MVKHGQKYKGWYDYKLLFKEKIQGIVNNISLEKVSESVDQTNIYLNARALYKNHGIKDFPIKFSNGYNHYNKRVICNRVGECEIKPRLRKVAHVDNVDIFVNAVVDLQTLEKHFNYSLQKKLFGKLELLNVSFQVRKKIIEPVVKQAVVKHSVPMIQRTFADIKENCIKHEWLGKCMSGGERFVKTYENGVWTGYTTLGSKRRTRGNVGLNFNFGKGRSRGNINMNQRW